MTVPAGVATLATMDRKAHQIDKDLASAGVWSEYEGSRFLIASNTTPAWARAMAKYEKKVNPVVLKNDAAAQADCILQAAADVLLLSWENVTDGGEPFPPTPANKLDMMRTAPEFREWVFSMSRNLSNFQKGGEANDTAAVKSEP